MALGGVVSTGAGKGSTLILRRGRRSLDPAGRPFFFGSLGAGFSGVFSS